MKSQVFKLHIMEKSKFAVFHRKGDMLTFPKMTAMPNSQVHLGIHWTGLWWPPWVRKPLTKSLLI